MKIRNASLKYVIMLEMLQSSQPSILSKILCIFLTLKFAAIQFGWRTFLQLISEHQSPKNKLIIKAAMFSEQYRLSIIDSSHLKQLLFCRKIFFRIPSCLEQPLLSNNYFLVTNIFGNQLLLKDKYFFSTASVWEELFLQNK